jgi:hypothetical protein
MLCSRAKGEVIGRLRGHCTKQPGFQEKKWRFIQSGTKSVCIRGITVAAVDRTYSPSPGSGSAGAREAPFRRLQTACLQSLNSLKNQKDNFLGRGHFSHFRKGLRRYASTTAESCMAIALFSTFPWLRKLLHRYSLCCRRRTQSVLRFRPAAGRTTREK